MSAITAPGNLQTGLIRRARPSDLTGIVEIHSQAFPEAFLTLLGPGFLSFYYHLLLSDPGGILIVHENSRQIDAFVAGFLQARTFYTRMKEAKWTMLGCLATALKKQPSLAGRILYHVRRFMQAQTREHPEECELSSLAVHPEAWNRGIGRQLVQSFLEAAWSGGAPRVYLTTDTTGNPRTNQFYQRLGFQLRECFVQYRGRLLNEYVFHRRPQ